MKIAGKIFIKEKRRPIYERRLGLSDCQWPQAAVLKRTPADVRAVEPFGPINITDHRISCRARLGQ